MANWRFTDFRIAGEQADLDAAMAFLADIPRDNDGLLQLEDLALALGCDLETTFCRGYIAEINLRKDYIEIYTETANQPPYQVIYLLCRKFSSLKYYFQVELDDEIITNDAEKKFFPPMIKVYVDHEGKDLCGEFYDYEEAMQWANEIFGTGFDSDSYLTAYVQASVENSYCQFVFTRVIGEDEQLTTIPLSDCKGLAHYTLAQEFTYSLGK